MSVRLGLLALLAEQPMHGYQLRQEFEARTGGTWPLNIGQVYTTVQRLVRDGLVEPVVQGPTGSAHTEDPADGTRETEQFTVTDAGRAEAGQWWTTPVLRGAPARDELAIKLALAVTVPGVDVVDVVRRQRTETMSALRDFTRLKGRTVEVEGPQELAWSLVLDNLVFATEAEMRWLDHVEARLLRIASSRSAAPDAAARQAARPETTATPPRVHR